jgi:abhydrolase domain-containing protein 14
MMQSSSYQDQWLNVNGFNLRYLANSLPSLNKPVVLLHGYSFNADDWSNIGTLDTLSGKGISFFAIDMPSGKKTKSQRHSNGNKYSSSSLLTSVFEKLSIPKAVVVGPSMGGNFAISFAMENPNRLSGLVLIAPALERSRGNPTNVSLGEALKGIPTMIVWGEKDNLIDVAEATILHSMIPNSILHIMKGAGHACYLDSPREFNDLLVRFVSEKTQ